MIGKSVSLWRFAFVLIAVFAGLVYGVISYSVTQRTCETGLRMALGAKLSQLLWMVEPEGLLLVGIGLVAGTAHALFGRNAIRYSCTVKTW